MGLGLMQPLFSCYAFDKKPGGVSSVIRSSFVAGNTAWNLINCLVAPFLQSF